MTIPAGVSGAYRWITGGTVTAAQGFRAGALAAGIKASGKTDLGMLVSDVPCVAAATFTRNSFAAAPVQVSKRHLQGGTARAIVFNSGNANACNGPRGIEDAQEMARLAAGILGIRADQVLVASTGIIGYPLPMAVIREALPKVQMRPDGGHDAALGIMTTDSHPKECAVAVEIDGVLVRVGGMAKGVGMIHPNMATLLAFVCTDAALEPGYARDVLRAVVDRTFNMITVDGDTSTNDTCVLLANGRAGHAPLSATAAREGAFESALEAVCTSLAREMAGDGEGAEKLIQVEVTGAASQAEARQAARAVVRSPLVKAAVHGEDPNWGRILMAVGNAEVRVADLGVALWLGELQVVRNSVGVGTSRDQGRLQMAGQEVRIRVDLGVGESSAVAWGCDLTEEYVVENSAYTT